MAYSEAAAAADTHKLRKRLCFAVRRQHATHLVTRRFVVSSAPIGSVMTRVGVLWRRNRALLIGFVFAVLVTLFFAVRLVVHAVYWSQHRDAELAEWMTIGYVAQSYHVERGDLARAVGLEPDSGRRLTLAEIARRTGQSVDEIETALLSAIQAERAKDTAGQQ